MGETMASMLDAERDRRWSSSQRTGSISREPPSPGHRARHCLRRAGDRGAAARPARERRARRCGWSGRTCPSGRSAAISATRSTSSRRVRSRLPGRGPRGGRARGGRRVLPQSRSIWKGSPSTATTSGVPCSSRARHDPPLERQGRDVRAAAPARRPGARVPARERAARGRGRRPGARLSGARSASSRCSRRARAGSVSSIPPSTEPTSCSTSGRDRSRCASRRRSSCCRPRAARTCS